MRPGRIGSRELLALPCVSANLLPPQCGGEVRPSTPTQHTLPGPQMELIKLWGLGGSEEP